MVIRIYKNKKEKKPAKNTRFQKILQKIKEEKTMNEYFIVKRLQRVSKFIGCFPSDSLPICDSYPCFYVINLDSSEKPGSHWIAVCENEKTLEVYDSLRLKSYPENIERFLSRKKNIRIRKVQSNTSYFCGLFACYFILMRQCHNFSDTLLPFSRNLKINDDILCVKLESLW